MVYIGYSQIAASLDFRPIVIWRRSAADGRCVTQLMESWFQERKWRMIAIYLTEKMDTELIATTLRWARNKTYLKIETAVFLSSFISFEIILLIVSVLSFFLFFFHPTVSWDSFRGRNNGTTGLFHLWGKFHACRARELWVTIARIVSRWRNSRYKL